MNLYISKINAITKKKEDTRMMVNFFAPPRKIQRTPCPKNLVLFEAGEGNKRIRRCQSTCPSAMSAVKGVCRANVNGTSSGKNDTY
ncbi:hypothetical protein OESDEN_04890 [Oesophagostomum dentatum]|uniref:Uncharacterized protein n=1 Tax=Oesophagostomum dentatum TaxID=61180 RepID=A0A0B1TCC4_OESDE|nr:hypothetical protein OESDEN_04890 [Oesophagostomum dentatum]